MLRRYLIFPCLLLLFLCGLTSQAAPGPLIVILVPGTSLIGWQRANAPHLHQLMAEGAIAVMNTRTARLSNDHRRETPESAILTLGAGARAAGGSELTDFAPVGSEVPEIGIIAGDLFVRRMGQTAPPGSLVNLSWPRVLQENTGLGYDLRPGNLAESLLAEGVTLAASGPLAYPIAVDSSGIIHDSSIFLPPGVLPPKTCVILDAGSDLVRADSLIGTAMARIGSGRLIVLSPSAGDQDYQNGDRLCPIVMWGRDVAPGLLYSPSTHHAGLVTNTDFAPTVAAYFGSVTALPVRPFGGILTVRPAPNAFSQAALLATRSYAQANGMRALPYLAAMMGLWLVVCLVRARRGVFPMWSGLIPLVTILALILGVSPATLIIALLLLACVSGLALRRWGPANTRFLLLALIASVLTLDLAAGGLWMSHSLLGYSAVEGARYYGMGNEAMGALVGTWLVLLTWLWERNPKRGPLTAGLIALVLIILLGVTGAKAGGVLVATLAFGTLLFRRRGGQWHGRMVAGLAALMLAAIGAIALVDTLHHGGSQSHIGQAVDRIHAGGIGEAMDIILRKAKVEERLLYHSAWAIPLWAGLLSLCRHLKQETLHFKALREAGLSAVIACLVFNDAGVVAGALCALIVWAGRSIMSDTPK